MAVTTMVKRGSDKIMVGLLEFPYGKMGKVAVAENKENDFNGKDPNPVVFNKDIGS